MSLSSPPHGEEGADIDRPPSRLFTLLFGAAIIAIAIGYTWVWQVKTARTVAEAPPVLALAGATSYISADSASAERLMELLVDDLSSIPDLVVLGPGAASDSADQLLFADLRAGSSGHTLELRRIDAAADTLLHIYTVDGATLHEAVNRMAVQVSMSLGLPRPARPPSDTGGPGRR